MTYFLWDIDGVFNPFMATDLIERGFVHFDQDWISWDLDLLNHGAWMRDLETKGKFVWASSWGDDSNALIKWFHLDSLHYPYIPLQMNDNHEGTWKLASVKDWVENQIPADEKVVWVDDEVENDAVLWVDSRPNTLLVRTDPAVGLTEQQYQRILDFLAS
jgi:hypothetical protein